MVHISQSQQRIEALLWALLPLVVLLVIVIGVIWLYRRRHARAAFVEQRRSRMLAKAYERAAARADHSRFDPLVAIEFHTYYGALSMFTQEQHREVLPASVALEYVEELHNFNLRSCLIPYAGSLYVPWLSLIEYRKQKRRIAEAVEAARRSSIQDERV